MKFAVHAQAISQRTMHSRGTARKQRCTHVDYSKECSSAHSGCQMYRWAPASSGTTVSCIAQQTAS